MWMQCDKFTDKDTAIDVKLCNYCTETELALLFFGMAFGAWRSVCLDERRHDNVFH